MEYVVDGDVFVDTEVMTKLKSKLLGDIGDIVVGGVQRGVDQQKEVNGSPYRKLKEATIKAKRRHGSTTPTTRLMDTGKMVNLVDKKVNESQNEVVISPSGDRNKRLAQYHQDGTESKWGAESIPATNWLGISQETDSEINKRIDKVAEDLIIGLIQGEL